MKMWQTRSPRVGLLILLVMLLLTLFRLVAHAYPVPELPADNLIVNPWFRNASDRTAAGFDGWTLPLTDGVTWGPSQKESNPSPDIVVAGTCGFEEVYCGTAARWAEQSGILYPDIDVFAYQIVTADPSQRKLRFFTHYVSHRVDVGAVNIYGSNTADGPWTLLWIPLYHSQDEQIVPEDGEVRDLWEETGFIEYIAETGYPYYKVELQSRLPQNPIIRGVGFKLTGIYFSTASTNEPGLPLPTPGWPIITVPVQEEGGTIGPTATESLLATAEVVEATPVTSETSNERAMPPATAVAAAEESGSRALTTLAIASLSSTENLITWDSGANNGRGFRLERSLDGTTDWRSIATVEAGTTNYIDGGLRPDTLYYYRFRTSQTDISDVVSARTEPLVETETGEPKPAEAILTAPTSLRAISNTPGQLTLTWEDISNNEAGFAIERSLDGVNFTAIEITTPGTTAFVERDLDPAIYFYRLRSVSGDNYSSYSDIVSVTVRGMLVESDTDEVVSQPNLSSTPEQPANTASIGQRWLITLAATLFVALVGVILLLVRAKQHPL